MVAEDLRGERLRRWSQTTSTRIATPDGGAALIERVGIATLFPASPEIPNLYHAFMGDPDAATDSGHDSPSGQVYSWRWALGGANAAFYSSIVRKRPTWVSWGLLPSVLRLLAESRTPDELFDLGVISPNAYRIAQVLEEAEEPLSTGDLRREAGFPMGKDQRAAYLKAVEELETRVLLAKVFSAEDLDMRHVLVGARYEEYSRMAEAMTREAALDRLLATYLPAAVYAAPRLLARHLGMDGREIVEGLERLVEAGVARREDTVGGPQEIYVWNG